MLATDVKTLPQLFRRRVTVSPDRVNYQVKRDGAWRQTTWSQFAQRVDRLQAALVDQGLAHGDAIAICGGCCPEWVLCDLAAMTVGAVTVGIYETLRIDQAQYILEDAKARMLFVHGREQLERLAPMLDAVESLEWIVAWDHEVDETDRVLTLAGLDARGQALREADPSVASAREAAVEPGDVALVVYTSGTTGQPKGVPLTHGTIIQWMAATQGLLANAITDEDMTVSFLPMAHVAEHVPGLFGRMNTGLPTSYATSYDTLIDELAEVRPTYFGAVPRIFEKMHGRIRERVAAGTPVRKAIFGWAEKRARNKARAERDGTPQSAVERFRYRVADRLVFSKLRAVFGGRVRYFITGSAPIDIEILEFFAGTGMTILEVYGLSESCAIAFANTVEDHRLGTVGRAIPGVECKLAEDGEILLRGETIFAGYRGLPGATAEAFDADGFFRSGDIGVFDDEGYLKITDRKKNLIKTSGGKYVVPARLESLLKEEPSVGQVYIHGDRRPFVVALVTVDERELAGLADELGVSAPDVPAHPEIRRRVGAAIERANTRLARFEQIKHFEVLPEDFTVESGLVTPTLKIKRRVVAERYADRIDAMYKAASEAYAAGASDQATA